MFRRRFFLKDVDLEADISIKKAKIIKKKKNIGRKRVVKKSKQEKLNCSVSIDGWLNFLQGQYERKYSVKLALIAIAFSVIAILISISVAYFINEIIIYTIISSIFFSYFIWYIAKRETRNAELAERLINKILKGDLSNSNQVRNIWLAKKKQD